MAHTWFKFFGTNKATISIHHIEKNNKAAIFVMNFLRFMTLTFYLIAIECSRTDVTINLHMSNIFVL